MNLKILLFCTYLHNRAGIERMTVQLANMLAGSADVTILSLEPFSREESPYEIDSRVKTDSLNSRFNYSVFSLNHRNIRLLRSYLKNSPPQLIITVETPLLRISAPAIKGMKIKNIVWEHFILSAGSLAGRIYKIIAPRFADATVVLTEENARIYRKFSSPGITLIPNFTSIKTSVASPCDKKRVLAIGRHTPQKGFDMLLKGWAKGRPEGWTLKIVGSGHLRKENEMLAESLGISGSVTFADAHPAIEEEFHNASCLVMTSRYEGIGLVLIEAKMSGLPCLSFNCPSGPKEVIRDGIDGWLLPAGDIEALATAFSRFPDNPEWFRSYGEKARLDAISRFSEECAEKKWLNLIRKVMEKQP